MSKITRFAVTTLACILGLAGGRALVCEQNVSVAKAEGEVFGTNYFAEGDFEQNTQWDLNNVNHYELQSAVSHSGTALKLDGHSGNYVQRNAISLPKGYVYALEYYIYVQSAYGIQFSTFSTGTDIGWIDFSSKIQTSVTDGWQKVTSLLTVNGDKSEQSAVYFGFKFYSGSGTVYLDDITLVAVMDAEGIGGNFDFESSYNGIPANWTYSGDGSFETQNEIKPEKTKGSNTAKFTNITYGQASYIGSQSIPVIGGRTYEASYMCKVEGDWTADSYMQFIQYNNQGGPAYSTTFDATKPNDYYRSKGKSGSDEFISPAWQYHIYGESEWRRVAFSFTVSTEASYITSRIVLLGRNASVYIDDVSIKELATDSSSSARYKYDDNSDFERVDADNKPTNWYLSSSRSYKSLLTSDTTHYHDGHRSLYLESTGTIEKTLLENGAKIPVNSGSIYEFGAYFSSRNCDPQVKISLNLYYFDEFGDPLFNEFGDRLYFYGETLVASCADTQSEWRQLYTRSAVPSVAKYVSYYFEIKNGHSEIWIDDITLLEVECESQEEKLEFHTDFNRIDSDGLIDGFTLHSDGVASFTKGEGCAELFVNSGADTRITKKLYNFITDYQYHVLFNYNSNGCGYIRFDFFNVNGVLIEGCSQERTFTSDSDPINFYFDAPSSSYAVVSIGLNGVGVLNLNYLYIYQSRMPTSKGEWKGQWVWYNEDATKNVEVYRYFRYTFDLEAKATYAPLQVTVDDKFVIYVNGVFVDFNWDEGADSWANVHTYYLQDYLLSGKNVIAIKAYNLVSEAAVLFDGIFTLENGSQFSCASSQYIKSHLPSPSLGDVDIGEITVPVWALPDFDDSSWDFVKELGIPPTSPWGPVYYDSSLYCSYSLNLSSVSCQRKIEAGETLEYSLTISIDTKIDSPFGIVVGLVPTGTDGDTPSEQKVTCNLKGENSDMKEWPVNEEFTITLSMRISSLLNPGRYDLRLESTVCNIANDYLDGERIIDNRFARVKVLESSKEDNELISTVENYNGGPTLLLNGKPYSPSLYLRPDLDVYRQTDAEDRISNSTYELYITYQGCLGKSGQDELMQKDGTLDFDAFDDAIKSLLNASVDGYVMVNFGMFAPSWWMNEHPSEVSYAMDKNGRKIKGEGVSFSSELWLKTSNELLAQLIEHMKTQKYYDRVFGLRITAGQTYEFMNYGASGKALPDYSDVALTGFRKWLTEKYENDANLRASWNNNSVSLKSVTIPTFNERGVTGYGTIVDPTTDMRILDYNTYLASKSADCLLTWAKTCKDLTNNTKIVGAYYGYMWAFGSYDGASTSHVALAKVLSSEYIDFIASPINYNERILGMSTTFMSMLDTVQLYGKLYLLEQDNRSFMSTSYSGSTWDASWDYQVGGYHTAYETMCQFKRDFVHNFADGSGYWNYDMYGGWLDDPQIYEFMSQSKGIYDFSLTLEHRSFTKDVAIFMSDNYYSYLSVDDEYNSTYILTSSLLAEQRENLNRMGTSYDTYTMSSLAAGLVPEHKVNIFISTFEINAETLRATQEYLSRCGGYAIWIYACGISNGTAKVDSAANMKALTGFDLNIDRARSSLQIQLFENTNNSLLDGIGGKRYGTTNALVSPQISIKESDNCVSLGRLTDGGRIGLGIKEMGSYKSIYSAGPCLPTKLLRNILAEAGVHIYSQNTNDIIYSNNNYVGLHSAIGEAKFIQLDGYYAVWDEFEQRYLSLNTNVIIYQHEANDTKLFRLDPVGGRSDPQPIDPKEKGVDMGEFIGTTFAILGILALLIGGKFIIKKIKNRRAA